MSEYSFFSISRLRGSQPNMNLLRCGVTPRNSKKEIDFLTSEYAVLCMLEGSGVYVDEYQKRYPFRKGDLIQRFPNRRHSICWNDHGVAAYLAVPSQIYFLLEKGCDRTKLQSPIISGLKVRKRFYQECLHVKEMLEELPRIRYIEVFNRLQQFFASILNTPDQTSLVGVISELLSNDPSIRYTNERLARYVSMSDSVFRDKFMREAGISPGMFVIRKRIESAKQLLLENKLTIGEIADKLGYPDIYTFSRQFKKFANQTPTRFRDNPEG